jgi:hypothetical protein
MKKKNLLLIIIIKILGSLNYYANQLDKDYLLIETTGQNNIQPIDIRVDQVIFFVLEILKNFI